MFSVHGQIVTEDDPNLKKIDVIEHLGEKIPLDLEFRNDKNQTVTLDQYFNKEKPVLLTLAYYRCPMLCTFVLNGLVKGASSLPYTPGNEYQIVTISIDPNEKVELAAAKKSNHVAALKKPGAENGWDFLIGEAKHSEALAEALGFKFYYDEERDEYAHPAVSFILTEQGVISRYLYGIEYQERDLRLALLEASEGKIGSTLDKIILYCYHYDPDSKGYVIFAGNVMRAGGVITVMVLGGILLILWRKEFRRKAAVKAG
jgi:protein SCO1/2